MAELITSLISFVFDNIGFILGLLVILGGISSSKNRKKQKQEKQASEANPDVLQDKNFREIMAELQREAEAEKHGDFEPRIPYEPSKNNKNNRPWDASAKQTAPAKKRHNVETTQPRPQKQRQKGCPPQSVTPHTVVHQPGIHVDAKAAEPVRKAASSPLTSLNQLSGDDLVRGVIMAEVLGKPKAFQDQMN